MSIHSIVFLHMTALAPGTQNLPLDRGVPCLGSGLDFGDSRNRIAHRAGITLYFCEDIHSGML